MKKSCVAIITARGGSKRIPRKNIKDFLGRPIIEYSIKAALESRIFDEVMVSTDDEEIAEIAKNAGAKVPFMRSKDTANDFATTADVIAEVLQQYKTNDVEFDYVCCIYPTAPFLTAKCLKEAMELLMNGNSDSVVPVVKFGFPPQRGVIIQDGRVSFKWPEFALARSQDLESMYHDCGQFYCLNIESFEKQKCLVMANTMPYIREEKEVQDIDTMEDWYLAEIKYRMLYGDMS